MTPVMLFLGLIVVVVGMAMLSQATMGVGVIAIGCFLGICARIVQAGGHQRKTERLIEDLIRKTTAPPIQMGAAPAAKAELDVPVVVGGIVVRE
jgi:hypothetical protein